MASRRSGPQGGFGLLESTVYAWVPSQEELHSLWRADEPQAYPSLKKSDGGLRGARPGSFAVLLHWRDIREVVFVFNGFGDAS